MNARRKGDHRHRSVELHVDQVLNNKQLYKFLNVN